MNKQSRKNQTAIDNFISFIDLALPMHIHFKNCLADAASYKWHSDTIIEIMAKIEEIYKKDEDTRKCQARK